MSHTIDTYLDDLLGLGETPAPIEPVAKPAAKPAAPYGDSDELEALFEAESKKAAAAASMPAASVPATTPVAALKPAEARAAADELEALFEAESKKAAMKAATASMPAHAAAAPSVKPVAAAPMPASLAHLFAPGAVDIDRGAFGPSGDRRRRAADKQTRWLRFQVATQSYAVEVLKVQEVLRMSDIVPLRGSAPALVGVMNLRGQIVPVMELATWLGAPRAERDLLTRIVVLEENGEALGLVVANVAEVVSVADSAIEPSESIRAGAPVQALRGVTRHAGELTVLLDATKLLAA